MKRRSIGVGIYMFTYPWRIDGERIEIAFLDNQVELRRVDINIL